MLRYAITQRTLFSGDDLLQRAALVRQAARWAADGIDFIQLREKDLATSNLAMLARDVLEAIHNTPTKLLINSRPDVALATAAHGVHLAAHPGQLTPTQVRHLYAKVGAVEPLISVACHTLTDITQARRERPAAILFAPVFEKIVSGHQVLPGTGLERLHEACQAAAPIPVYALGGITAENAPQCLAAGAAGVAGIRLFHDALAS